ncbi:MAG TPA: MarR family transcriptional regulator [Humibacillus sp.]|nr:MarR family transcriptional regulator [Humibacillus sp.]
MTEPSNLGNDLLRSAARLSRWASRHASFDVPFAQARLLALLDELGPARVSALAAADHSSQPSVTTQLHRLETAGWVERAVDPDDARASLVSLTDAGRDALEDVRRARLAVLAPALDGLDGPALARVRVAIDVLDELLAATAEPHTSHPTRRDR